VAAADWGYVDAKLNAVKLTSGNFGAPGSFGPTALYEFTYVAKDPVVASLGLAAIRDIATYLSNAETDDKGVPNPLAGDVAHIYSFCSSQPCRTMHDYVQLGFNQPERVAGAAPPAFDGILNWKAGGSGLFINYRFSQPVRTHRQHIARWTPEYQFPFADQKLTERQDRLPAAPMRGQRDVPQDLRGELIQRILGQGVLDGADRQPRARSRRRRQCALLPALEPAPRRR
jgi:hypothetical protein